MTHRIAIAAAAVTGAGVIALSALWHPVPLLVWNVSASVPVGLYALRLPERLTVDDLVIVRPPEPLAGMLADGRYLPRGVSLIKHIGALPGQTVCRQGDAVSVDGTVRAYARHHDHGGRLLPVWNGCRNVGQGEVFLLNAREPASLDSRYFGPLPSTAVIGRAVPLWVEGER